MNTVIVYVDDADHARSMLLPMVARDNTARTHWVLVACAPRMTHRISKWVSHSARESWRAKWSDKLFDQVLADWPGSRDHVTRVLAKSPLPDLMQTLYAEHGAHATLVDARRPKQEVRPAQDAAAPQPARQPAITKKPSRTWTLPGSLASLGLMMFMVAE